MPQFQLEIEIDDYLRELDQDDITYLVECLREDGHLDEFNNTADEPRSVMDEEWSQILAKLSGRNRLRISNSDIELITQIANEL